MRVVKVSTPLRPNAQPLKPSAQPLKPSFSQPLRNFNSQDFVSFGKNVATVLVDIPKDCPPKVITFLNSFNEAVKDNRFVQIKWMRMGGRMKDLKGNPKEVDLALDIIQKNSNGSNIYNLAVKLAKEAASSTN